MIPTASDRAAGAIVALTLLTLATVLFVVVPADEVERFARYHLPKELALLGGAVLLAALAFVRPPRALDALDAAALIAGASGLLACIGAVDADTAVRGALLTIGGVAVFIGSRAADVPRGALADGIALVIVAAALVVLAEALGIAAPIGSRGSAPGGLIGQRNNAAHVCALGAPLLFDRALRSSGARRALGIAGVAILVAAVLVTRSRSGWLAIGIGTSCAVWQALTDRAQRRGLVVALGAVAVGALVLLAPPGLRWSSARPYRETARHLIDTSSGSGHGRLLQARTTLTLLREAPVLGVGPGHWAVHYPRIAAPADPTVAWASFQPTGRLLTNDVLALLVERGLVGALPFLALAVLLLVRRSRDERWALPFAATLGVLMVLDCVVQAAVGLAVVSMLAALAAPRFAAERPRSARIAAVAAALLLIASLVGAWRAADRLAAQRAMVRAHSFAALAEAARAHPAALAPRLTLLEEALFLRDCAAAAPWLEEVRARRPHIPRVVEASAACARAALQAHDGPAGAPPR